jgi:hypothetical protein
MTPINQFSSFFPDIARFAQKTRENTVNEAKARLTDVISRFYPSIHPTVSIIFSYVSTEINEMNPAISLDIKRTNEWTDGRTNE